MNEVKPDAGTPPLFYCEPVNDKGGPCHAPDCDQRSSCMLQMKRQQHTKDGKPVTHQDHFRCTITARTRDLILDTILAVTSKYRNVPVLLLDCNEQPNPQTGLKWECEPPPFRQWSKKKSLPCLSWRA